MHAATQGLRCSGGSASRTHSCRSRSGLYNPGELICRGFARSTRRFYRQVLRSFARHTYAVQSLEAGSNVREVQEALGHRFVQSTMRYLGFLVPALSPLDSTGAFPPPLPVPHPAAALAGATDALDADAFFSVARTTREFLSTLRMQLGIRLFAPRGANRSTGPP